MIHSHLNFLSAVNCKYTINGQNLTELRRVKLRPIARGLGLDDSGTKNELLTMIIGTLDSKSAEPELADFIAARKARAEESKPKKKAAKKK